MKMEAKDVFERLIRRDVPRMSQEFFDSIPDEQLINTVWTHLIEKKPEMQSEVDFLASLPQEARWLHLIEILDGEVCNAGFNQYFFNTEGAYTAETVEALHKMCGPKHAEPLENAMRFLEQHAETVKESGGKKRKIQEMLDVIGDAYDDLDFGDFDADWKRLEKPRQLQMVRFLRAKGKAFVDSKQELAISDALNEPTKFTDSATVKKECAAITAEPDKNSRIKKFLALATKYASENKLLESELVLREALASMRWMPMGGTKDPMFFEILRQYKPLLEQLGRTQQSQAVHEHLEKAGQLTTKSRS